MDMKDTGDGGSYQRVTSTKAHGRPEGVEEFENGRHKRSCMPTQACDLLVVEASAGAILSGHRYAG